ncbi:MAG: serine hydrolase [Nitrososphaeraceae archaeon]|nr:serine hydrolase [Nitrososphaeraceae archaeon]
MSTKISTKINDILQETHLIRHEEATIANSSATTQSLLAIYIGLGWDIVTNLGTEVIYHTGGIDGYHSLVAFNPTKQIGSVVLCSCDEKDDLPADWVNTVILSLLRSSGIFAPAKAAPITNASLPKSLIFNRTRNTIVIKLKEKSCIEQCGISKGLVPPVTMI